MKEKICAVCNNKVERKEPSFFFPHMPKWHKFFDLSGKAFHINCIKEIDSLRHIGKELADITVDMASRTEFPYFLSRDGNIVVLAELDEQSISFIDYENYVEFSVPLSNIEFICALKPCETVNNRMTALKRENDDEVKLITTDYEIMLLSLNFTRLIGIIKGLNLDLFDKEYIEQMNRNLVLNNSKRSKKNHKME